MSKQLPTHNLTRKVIRKLEQHPFDKAVKDSLANLEADYKDAHWQQMDKLLNNLPIAEETEKPAYFDALIKNKIEDLTTQKGIHTNWSVIETALDKTRLEAESQFDTAVYSKLNSINKNYQESNWQKLVTRLNANLELREKIYRYKLLEATLLILLLLNFYQYLPDAKLSPSKDVGLQIATTTHSEKIREEIYKESLEHTNENPTNHLIQNPIEEYEERPQEQEITAPSEAIDIAQLVENSSVDYNLAKQTRQLFNELPRLSNITKRLSTDNLSISVSEMNNQLSLYSFSNKHLIPTIPSLKPEFIESYYITPLGCKGCKHTKIPARLRLGIIANLAINNVYRTGGQVLNIGALSLRGFGYGSGISLGFKYGRLEIETGLTYNAKQYDPNIVEQHGGIVSGGIRRTHFQTIHLQTLHLPVNLRYNYAVFGKGKWHFYAQTGAALNVIMRAEYDLADISAGSRSLSNNITTSRLSQIDYNNGLLAGDGFNANRFVSVSMGAGVERYISPRWSIFVQPDFHFHFSGNRIGPTEDRINTLSLSFGARKSL